MKIEWIWTGLVYCPTHNYFTYHISFQGPWGGLMLEWQHNYD
jgi:hypothetical protein